MPHLVIRTVNSAFDVADQGRDYASTNDASAAAVRAGVAIAAEEIVGGARAAIIEICVEQMDGTRLARSVVSLATSPLDNG